MTMPRCIKLPHFDCIPCTQSSQSNVKEKDQVESQAVSLFIEEQTSESELDCVLASNQVYKSQLQNISKNRKKLPLNTRKNERDKDTRSSILGSVVTKYTRDKAANNVQTLHGNDRDPITLEPLFDSTDRIFSVCVLGNCERDGSKIVNESSFAAAGCRCGPIVHYNVTSLVRYIVSTGDFCEPTTRRPFSDSELSRLDRLAGMINKEQRGEFTDDSSYISSAKEGVLDQESDIYAQRCCGQHKVCDHQPLPSVVAAKKHNGEAYAEAKLNRDLGDGLERCVGEVLSAMLDEIDENRDGDPCILVGRFHDFDHYLAQLRLHDIEKCHSCLVQMVELSRGPKNKRREDPHGLLIALLGFLNEKMLALSEERNSFR